MSPQEFCYWLQGLFELGEPAELTPKQVDLIERHLDMVDVTINANNVHASVGSEVQGRC